MKNLIYITLALAFVSCTNKQGSNSPDEETTQSNNYAQTQSDNNPEPTEITPTESSTDFVPVITTSTTENTYPT